MGIGSHLTFVFLRAELSRDLKDSFLWKFCSLRDARVEVKVRDGAERRACGWMGALNRGRRGARMSWREQEDAMFMVHAWAMSLPIFSITSRGADSQWRGGKMTAKASRGVGKSTPPANQ